MLNNSQIKKGPVVLKVYLGIVLTLSKHPNFVNFTLPYTRLSVTILLCNARRVVAEIDSLTFKAVLMKIDHLGT